MGDANEGWMLLECLVSKEETLCETERRLHIVTLVL